MTYAYKLPADRQLTGSTGHFLPKEIGLSPQVFKEPFTQPWGGRGRHLQRAAHGQQRKPETRNVKLRKVALGVSLIYTGVASDSATEF